MQFIEKEIEHLQVFNEALKSILLSAETRKAWISQLKRLADVEKAASKIMPDDQLALITQQLENKVQGMKARIHALEHEKNIITSPKMDQMRD
jgi:hypothetical protein